MKEEDYNKVVDAIRESIVNKYWIDKGKLMDYLSDALGLDRIKFIDDCGG